MNEDADRKRVLPESARRLAREIASDPKKSKEFLIRAGIIDADKGLHANYRSEKEVKK